MMKMNNANQYLSKKDALTYIDFFEDLPYIAGYTYYLGILASNTADLTDAFITDIQQNSALPTTIATIEQDEAFYLHKLLLAEGKTDGLLIIPIFLTEIAPARIAQMLIANRDTIHRNSLKVAFILSRKQFDITVEEAIDFIQFAHFAGSFIDQSNQIQKDLAKNTVQSKAGLEYQDAEEALQNALATNEAEETLMKRYFTAARKAQDLSLLSVSKEYYLECIKIAKHLENKAYLSWALGNIGVIYKNKGDLDEALKYLKQALSIHKEIGYLQGQANQLGNIGLIYKDKGDLDEALKYHKQALSIDKEIGYLQGEASDLGNIGLIYKDKGDLDEALKYLKQALSIHKEIGYLQGEASALGNIGLIYSNKGDLDEALKYLKQALSIHKEIGYLQGEASDLGNIGLIYSNKGDLDEALKYLKSSLEIAQQVGIPYIINIVVDNIKSIEGTSGKGE